jgi:hypothetical protein
MASVDVTAGEWQGVGSMSSVGAWSVMGDAWCVVRER